MTDTQGTHNIADVSPYSPLSNFSKSRVMPATLLAVVLHVMAIGGLSTGYIYRTWIDPAPDAPDAQAAAGDATSPAASQGEQETTNESSAAIDGSENPPVEPAASSVSEASETPDTPPVVERVTEAANPDEIPPEPDGLGISIDDIKD